MIDYFMTNEALLRYVGKQMQQMRINARLSQQQLAERAGVSRSTVTQVENGKRLHITRNDLLAVTSEAGIKAAKANEIIDHTLEVIGRFEEYVGDSIPEWMRQPIQKQLDSVKDEL